MDDPAFMLLQLQENLRFVHPGARLLFCMVRDEHGEPYWTCVILTYDPRGNVQRFLDPYDGRAAEWTNQPLEALRNMHLSVAAQVTDRLIIDDRPLRQLAQQRLEEAAARSALRASNNPSGAQQTMAPVSASRQTSEYLRSQNSDIPPAYKSQETSSVHVQRSARLSTRDTLDSIVRVSSRPRKMQGFNDAHGARSPVHLPLVTTPANTMFPEDAGSDPGTTPAGSGWRHQTSATFQRARLRSAHGQPRTSASSIPASNPAKTKATSQVAQVNVANGPSRAGVQQSQPLNPRAATFSNPPVAQPPEQNDNIPISRLKPDYSFPQGVHGMRALHPTTTIDPLHQRHHERSDPLSGALSSRPPYPGASVDLHIPPSTWGFLHSDPAEFLRRVEVHKREQFGPHDILAPIGDSASEFARGSYADLNGHGDGGVTSLATRIGDYGIRSRRNSSSSGETVRASEPLRHRRRVTQRRLAENETGDPVPPPAPSPPPNDVYPANLPVYPSTLVNPVSGASVRRTTSSAVRVDAASRVFSDHETQSMRRLTLLGPGSVSSVSRQGTFDERHEGGENERLLCEEQRAESRRVPQNHKGNQGERLPLIPQAARVPRSPPLMHPSTAPLSPSVPLLPLDLPTSSEPLLLSDPHIPPDATTDPSTPVATADSSNTTIRIKPKFRAFNKLWTMSRKVSEGISGGGGGRNGSGSGGGRGERRFTSLP